MPVSLEVRDGRKQLGSRLPPELLKHLRATAVEQDTTVTKLVIEAVTRLSASRNAAGRNTWPTRKLRRPVDTP